MGGVTSQSLLRKPRGNILTPVQNSNDQNFIVGDQVNDQVLFMAMNADRRAKVAPLSSYFWL